MMVQSQLLFNRFLIDGSLISVPCLSKGHILRSMLTTQFLERNVVDSSFNEIISLQEVKNAIFKSTMGKAYGVDGIPSEFLHNDIPLFTSYLCYSTFILITVLFLQYGANV